MTAIEWQLPSAWATMKLELLAPEDSNQIRPTDHPADIFNYWGLDVIDKGQFAEPQPNWVHGSEIASTCVRFNNCHLLYSKLRPYLNKVIIPSVEGIGTTEWVVLQPNPAVVDRHYLAYVLRSEPFVTYATANSTGARMPRVRKDALREALIPIPYPDDPARSLEIQRRIVARLDVVLAEVAEAQRLHAAIVADTERVMEAVIGEVFNRPTDGWQTRQLSEVAFIQTGTAKGRDFGARRTVELPYLRVANVQAGYLDLSEIKTISIAEGEIDRYRLQAGDLLLTEGGDFDKLGRGAVWHDVVKPCIHQNHIFAVRFDQTLVQPEFAEYEMLSWHAKGYFLGAAKKTTNLATINRTQLAAFPIKFPDLIEQERIVACLNSMKQQAAELKAMHGQNGDLLAMAERTILAQAFRGD